MQQDIGGTKAMTWVEHILSLNLQVKTADELKEFMESRRSLFGPGEPLDMTTRKLMEPLFGHNLEDVRIHRGYQAEEASRRLNARAFTFKGHIFGPRQSLDNSTKEGLGLLAHELTHAIQQTQPHQLPKRQVVNQEDSLMSAAKLGQPNVEMALLAPLQSSPLTTNPQQIEEQAQVNEQLVAEGLDNRAKSSPEVSAEMVANKVYQLMKCDLVLERERAAKLGG